MQTLAYNWVNSIYSLPLSFHAWNLDSVEKYEKNMWLSLTYGEIGSCK